MSEIEFKKLKEISWRRKLTAQEQAALDRYLATHSEARTLWEEETGLSRALGKLPDVPVSTNFTARVLQAIERDEASNAHRKHGVFDWVRHNWMPKIALVSLLLCAGVVSVKQYKRTQVALDVAAVSSAAAMPQQWLQDFDAIDRLSPPPVDTELLAALQ